MIIHEPATLATDLFLALLAAIFAYLLRKKSLLGNPSIVWWYRSLVLLSLSALIGGVYHGFAPNFSPIIDDITARNLLLAGGL